MCCEGCPRVFHLPCVGLARLPDDDWYCDECTTHVCAACDNARERLTLHNHVICGEEREGGYGCDRFFHLACVGLDALPEGDWLCSTCRPDPLGVAR